MGPKFQWFVFTVKRPELLVTIESGYRGVPAGYRGPLKYVFDIPSDILLRL